MYFFLDVGCNYGVPVCTEDAPEKAMRTSFLSTFGIATDQGGKLGLGKTKSVICMYSSYQVITCLVIKVNKMSSVNKKKE